MLYLLDKDVKTVKWNGIPLHEASSAIVKEEVNGDFVLTVRYPITDSGIYQLIKEDMLIKAPTPVLGPQLFRIKKPVENDDSLDITAYHITDDVMQRSINPVSVVGQGCAMALSQMVQNAKTDLGTFSFTSDIMDSRTFNTTDAETLYSVLLDGKHSIVGTWEGELVRDNLALTVKRSRGADRGVVITTHKNLKSYQRTKNSQSVVTRIHAKSTFKADGAEDEVTLRVTVDSPLINSYPYINEKEYENNNAETVEDLRKWAEAKFKNEGIDKVSDAIEIEAYELDGQVVHLGDTVNIKSSKHSVDIYKKAIAYEYNALTEEYISITFDDKPGVGGSGVSSGVSNAADVILSANQNAQEVAIERAVRNATQAFDAEFEKQKISIEDGIEQAKAEAELYADSIKQSIDTEIDAVNASMQAQSEEHDRQVADILSKTQSVETLVNQAKSDAASAIARANQVKTEAIADARAQVATVSQTLNTAKTELQTAIASADQKARDSQASATVLRNDLNLQASKILEQARAQTALTNRVTTVETLADGTKTTVAELSKTVSKATGDITSVTSRTKTVEDTLSQTRTQYDALTQTVNAQTGQIDSINRKTADLQSGIDGVTERFESLQVGGENLLLNAGFEGATNSTATFIVGGVTYIAKRIPNWYDLYNSGIANPTTSYHAIYRESFEGKGPVIEFNESDGSRNWKAISAILDTKSLTVGGNYMFSADIYSTGTGTKIWFGFYYYNKNGVRNFHSGQTTINISTINKWHRVAGQIKLNEDIDLSRDTNFYIYAFNFTTNSILYLTKPKLENGTVATAFSLAQETIRSEIAEYRRTADQNYAGLQSTVTTLDGKVTQNKTEANQSATQLSNRLTSLETYKDAESTRAQAYFEASKTETAKQLTAERTAIANNYVAKSIYDENVRGTTLKLNEIKTTADTAKQNLATYQNTVDQKLTELTSSTQTLDGKINTASAKITQNAQEISKRLTSTQVNQAILADKQIKDTRNDNQTPQWYWTNYPKQTVEEFKGSAVIGLTGESTFAILTTNVQWQDSTGGKVKQTAKTDRATFERYGSGTTWEAWTKIANAGDLANYTTKTEFQTVKETTSLYERIIGSTETGIKDRVARMVMADSLFMTEVKNKVDGTSTQVTQLSNAYAIKNLTSSGTVLNQLNLNKDGSVKIDGKLVQITGTTYIQDGVITSAKIAGLDAGKITTGYLASARIATNSITGSHMVFDQAFVNKMTANEALFKQLFAKNAFITSVQAVAISASNVTTGVLRATNGALDINLDNANITFNQNATINFNSDSNALVRKKGDVTAFVNFADDSISGGVYAGFGVTSHAVGVTTASNSDRGKFAGMRVYRPNDSLDLVRLIGDTIELRHGTEGKYFYFNPPQLRNNVDMLKLAGAVYTLSRIFMHLSANGWAFDHPSFISGVKNEMARNWLQDFANGGLPR